MELVGDAYQEKQPDIDKKERLVWVFKLKVLGEDSTRPVEIDKINQVREARERSIKKISNAELGERISHSSKSPGTRAVLSSVYIRSEAIVEAALREVKGICQLCGEPAPFSKKKNRRRPVP